MSYLISVQEALRQWELQQAVFLDARFVFGDIEAGKVAYAHSHIPGAMYFDLNDDLSGPILEHGGRHPLPDEQVFAHKLGQAGIDASTPVIVYDDQHGAVAARLWWMLHYYGHDQVKLLDAGFTGWVQAGGTVTSEPSVAIARSFLPQLRRELVIDVHEISSRLGEDGLLLIDSRTQGSYTAETPTKYARNGHIPGAVNYFWEHGVTEHGVFGDAALQRDRLVDLPVDREYAVYCNAGVTACPNVLALLEAGYEHVRLYVGSWGDWISYEHAPVATGTS